MSQQPSTTQMSRWAGIAGIGFAVLALVGFITAGGPNYNESDQTWAAWFQDSNHRSAQITGMFLVLASVLLLVVFFTTLRRQAVAAGGSAQASALTGAAGIMVATTVAVGTVIHNEVSAAMQFAPNNFPVPGPTSCARSTTWASAWEWWRLASQPPCSWRPWHTPYGTRPSCPPGW